MGKRLAGRLLILALLVAARATAVDFYIDAANGDDANDGTDPALPTRTVQHALDVWYSDGETYRLLEAYRPRRMSRSA